MGKKKLHNPFQIRKPANNVLAESSIALAEYKARMTARRELATNEEILRMADERDAWNENWMWGLFAIVLHRRYRFTAPKIVEIFGEIQALHNELYDGTQSYEETDRMVRQLVWDELGLDITSDLLEGMQKKVRRV